MIHVACNLCRRIIADDDADAFREGVTGGDRRRADICGACMREAADRVLTRLRTSVKVADPVPADVRQRALSVWLPAHLRRGG